MLNETKSIVSKDSNKVKEILAKFWDGFHKFGLWVTLFLLLGTAIGVSAAKKYYTEKLDEVILVGGMAHKGIVYQITKK